MYEKQGSDRVKCGLKGRETSFENKHEDTEAEQEGDCIYDTQIKEI